MTNQIDIIIKSMFESSGMGDAKKQLDSMVNAVSNARRQMKEMSAVGLKYDRTGTRIHDVTNGQIVGFRTAAEKINDFRESQKKATQQASELANIQSRFPSLFNSFRQGAKLGNNAIERFGNGLRGIGQSFNMAMLSALFFGMQINAVASSIIRSGVAAFMDITEASTAAGDGINHLKIGFKLLQFTIGEAIANYLLPFIPTIMEIIVRIANWISKNQELVSKILLMGGAFGFFLFALASISLGIVGVIDIFGKLIIGVGKIGGAFTWLVANPVGALIIGLSLLITALAFIAFTKYPETFKNHFTKSIDLVKESLSTFIDTIGDVVVQLAKLVTGADDSTEAWEVFASAFIAYIETMVSHVSLLINVISLIVNGINIAILGLEKLALSADKYFARIQGDDEWLRETESRLVKVDGKLNKFTQNAIRAHEGIEKSWEGVSFLDNFDQALADIQAESGKQLFTPANAGASFEQNMTPLGSQQSLLPDVEKTKQEATDMSSVLSTEAKRIENAYGEVFKGYSDNISLFQSDNESAKNSAQLISDDLFALSNEFTNVNQKANSVDFSKLTSESQKLSESLTAPGQGEEASFIDNLKSTAAVLIGDENSIVNAMDVWIGKMYEARSTIADVLIPEINNASVALESNSSAAVNAAKAQERYNRAVDGAFG